MEAIDGESDLCLLGLPGTASTFFFLRAGLFVIICFFVTGAGFRSALLSSLDPEEILSMDGDRVDSLFKNVDSAKAFVAARNSASVQPC